MSDPCWLLAERCSLSLQVVQFNRLPLVVSFIASSSANTGMSSRVF